MYNSNKLIEEYQQKVANRLFGMVIESVLKELGVETSPKVIIYVTTLLRISTRKAADCEPTKYLQVPVQYLFSSITPFTSEDYEKTTFKTYMGKFTRQAINPLKELISVSGYNEDYCRRFEMSEVLITKVQEKWEKIMNYKLPPVELIKCDPNVGIKPAKWGGRELTVKQLPSVTKAAWEKLKKSRFRFDWDLFYSDKGRIFNRSLKLNTYQNIALMSAMDDMQSTSKPQYHDSYFIQGPGRLHTKGGPMAMATPIRKFYVKAANPKNVCLEVDLKCAQLLILCDILGAASVKEQVLEIIKTDSIWKYIEPVTLDKKVKKVIVYGFCFGAKMYELPFLATQKAKMRYNIKYSVSSKDVKSTFSGLLKPLAELRDNWLSQYSLENIEAGKVDNLIHKNALGLEFNLTKEAANYRKNNRGKLDKLKVASQLLAHYAQGLEQLIIQDMIANCIEENIITYSYDGLTIEVEEDKINKTKDRLQDWLSDNYQEYLLESEVYR